MSEEKKSDNILKNKNIKKTFKNPFFWVVIVLLFIFGLYFFAFNGEKTTETEGDIALKVNEEEFSFDDYNRALNQVSQQYMMQGMDLPDEQLKEMATQSLIQQALLMEFLRQADIEVSSQELEDRLQQTIAMSGVSEEEFFNQLRSDGLDNQDEINELLLFEIRLDKYFEQLSSEVDISEEEVQESYDQFLAQIDELGEDEEISPEDIPSFEEVRDEIREGLIQEKIMPIIMAQLNEMQKDAVIESNLEEHETEISSPEVQMLDPEDLDIDLEELE